MSTFKVSNFTFVEKLPDKKGIFEEIEVTEDVELRHAERTRLEDSIFITSLLDNSDTTAERKINDAIKYVNIFVIDKTLAKRISSDGIACLSLFTSDQVQEDLVNFINRAGRTLNMQMPEQK